MALTANSGPNLAYGLTGGSTDGITTSPVSEYNDQRAPSLSDLGYGMSDPRAAFAYDPGNPVTAPIVGFLNGSANIDFVPGPTSSVALVNNTNSAAVTSFTLQAVSSARGTYATTLTAPENGATLSSILTFDSTGSSVRTVPFGVSQTIQMWGPASVGRVIAVTGSSYLDSPITIIGRDAYGYKITEQIAFSSNASLDSSFGGIGRKAFKYVTAVYNSTTTSSTGIVVGTANRFGYPLYVPYYGNDITVRVASAADVQNAAIALSSANSIRGMASSATATSTTADVRGIYVSSVTFAGDYRLCMTLTPSASALASVTASDLTGLFGATQYSSV